MTMGRSDPPIDHWPAAILVYRRLCLPLIHALPAGVEACGRGRSLARGHVFHYAAISPAGVSATKVAIVQVPGLLDCLLAATAKWRHAAGDQRFEGACQCHPSGQRPF